jgi:hypothetical protein
VTFLDPRRRRRAGRKRFDRDGCYQSESEGGTGGGGRAHDSEAGCHRAEDVERTFRAHLGAAAARRCGAAQAARRANRVVVRPRGRHALDPRPDDQAARELALWSTACRPQNQWYAQPPANPWQDGAARRAVRVGDGGGPACAGWRLSSPRMGAGGVTAACRRGERGAAAGAETPEAAIARRGAGRLANITAGLSPPGSGARQRPAAARTAHGINRTVEVAFAGGPRAPARPRHKAADVAKRFEARMRPLAAACALP